MSRTYVQPVYSGKQALIDAMNANVAGDLAQLVIAAALEEDDREFVERACIRLSAHPDEVVRGNAILGFGHIARIFGHVTEDAYAIIKHGLEDASDYVRGQAEAAASDVKHFAGVDVRRSNATGSRFRVLDLDPNPSDALPTLGGLLVRPESENRVGDIRFLVEAAALYRDVSLYANRTALTSLINDPQRDLLLELLEENDVRMLYHPDFPAVATNHDQLGNPWYDFGVIEGEGFDVFPTVEQALRLRPEGRSVARDVARRAERLIKTERLDLAFLAKTRANLFDDAFMTETALMVLRHCVPTYPFNERLFFRLRHHWGRLSVESNIDFTLASRLPKVDAAPTTITPAWLLAQYQAATIDLHLLEQPTVSAIATAPLYSHLLATVLSRTSKSLVSYKDFTFDAGLDARTGLSTSGHGEILAVARKLRRRHLDLSGGSEATVAFLDEFKHEVEAHHLPSRRLAWRVPIPGTYGRPSEQFVAA